MAWIAICKDIDDTEKAQQIRQTEAQAHLTYVETIIDKIEVAGPIADSEESGYRSSVLIYKTDTSNEAERLLHQDPYFRAGLYAEISIQWFKPAAGNWVGGKTW